MEGERVSDASVSGGGIEVGARCGFLPPGESDGVIERGEQLSRHGLSPYVGMDEAWKDGRNLAAGSSA